MKILIGYDGSTSADAIFDDLKLAGLPADSEAQIMSVAAMEAAVQVMSSRRLALALKKTETSAGYGIEEAKESAARARERLDTTFPDWNIESRVISGTAERELLEAAKNLDADLVVLGSQGRSAFGRLLLGSVSKTMANDAHCSVRIARSITRKKADAPPRIIIGIDGSASSEAAVIAVGQRVWREGTMARLVAVHEPVSGASIAPLLPKAAAMIAEHNQSQTQRADAMVEWARYQLKTIGINVSMSIQRGIPQSVLLSEAKKWRADCIFVGTRNFGSAFERLRLGSVSAVLAANAPCSVEIVRPRGENRI